MAWDSFDLSRRTEIETAGAEALGQVLRARREQLGLSQRVLGEIVVLDQSVISRLENGLVAGFRWRRLTHLIGTLGGLDPRDPLPTWVLRRRHR
jgi:predicted transcriptional regulator